MNADGWRVWDDPVQDPTTGLWIVFSTDGTTEDHKDFRTWKEADAYVNRERKGQRLSGKRRPKIFNDINPDTFEESPKEVAPTRTTQQPRQ